MINSCHTTKYFSFKRKAREGDPISAYLFIFTLKILFIIIKFDKNIDGINIFNQCSDDTVFFLKNQTSGKNALNEIKSFSDCSELCPNLDKSEIAGIGVLKNLNVAPCGLKNINVTKGSISILGVHIS